MTPTPLAASFGGISPISKLTVLAPLPTTIDLYDILVFPNERASATKGFLHYNTRDQVNQSLGMVQRKAIPVQFCHPVLLPCK